MKWQIALITSVFFSLARAWAEPAAAESVVFQGMCDASGAVPINSQQFMVADDEDNVLRIYDAQKGGAPVGQVVLTAQQLGMSEQALTKKGKPRTLELDIEAAAHIGDTSFWLTSHALNAKGKHKPERFQLIGLRAQAGTWSPVGKPYGNLVPSLAADSRYRAYQLDKALLNGAKQIQGLNIEGMTARQEGGVYIGFRNPVPKGRALIASLVNPAGVIQGEPPQWLAPIELDLQGLGVRGLSAWRGRYWILAGGAGAGHSGRLYSWAGGTAAPLKAGFSLPEDFNPEAFFTPEERAEFMVLSDDGSRLVKGVECKSLSDPAQKTFRGLWLRPAENPPQAPGLPGTAMPKRQP